MELNTITKMTRHELMECIGNKKNEMIEKLKTGETQPSFAIGSESYTVNEWDKLIRKFDKSVEKDNESLSIDLSEPETTKRNYFFEKINGSYKGPDVPYEYLAKDGVITYKGVIFTCNKEWGAICLGDMSNRKNVLTIPLSEGGCLMVNRDNLGDLSQAITMFSPEDQNRILRAIADDKKAQSALEEIEEEKSSIGDDADKKIFEDEELQMAILNQLITDTTAQTQNNKRV